MRCGKLYLEDVAECQGDLFVEAIDNHYDLVSFVEYYFNTRTRYLIDEGYPYYCTMLGHELYEFLTDKERVPLASKVRKTDRQQSGFVAEWLGVFYAYAQYYCNVSSKIILRYLPVESILERYNVLHDMDVKLAVERCCNRHIDVVCFHNPDEENGYLSNWYLSDFIVRGIKFTSMEQYMMYAKALLFKDRGIANQILNTSDVAKIKALGRKVSDFNEITWQIERENIITEGLYAKFSQNRELAEKLLSTKDVMLAECAVKDTVWGIGLSMTDTNRFDVKHWKGMNLLGVCLMNVRDRLLAESKRQSHK